jgi:hypothetical protein
MVVDQPRQDSPALEVDDLGLRTCQRITSLSAPTARNRPSRIATAVAVGCARASVVNSP